MSQGSYDRHAAVWDWSGHDRSPEADFWYQMAGRYGSRVIAAMCATGTVAAAMAGKGCAVTGVDISGEMIAEGQRRHGDTCGLTLLQGDILTLQLPEQEHDFAFIATTDLHHLPDYSTRLAALQSLARHTRTGGGLGLELWHPGESSFLSPWRDFYPLGKTSSRDCDVWKRGRTEYDALSRTVKISQHVFWRSDTAVEEFPHILSLYLFDRAELLLLLEQAGYSLKDEYGDFGFNPWTAQSPRWLVEAVKVT